MVGSLRVGLFVTCLVDSMRPSVGFASIELLERAGCIVEVPEFQTCCSQPAYNSGDKEGVRSMLAPLLDRFEGYDYVVVPSGSCGGMFKKHLLSLFPEGDYYHERALSLSEKTHELIYFLSHVVEYGSVDVGIGGKVGYHSSCSSLREIGLQGEAEKLLRLSGCELVELGLSEVCCGFGGLFSVKYSSISDAMVAAKCEQIRLSGCDYLVSCDLGCLLNIAGKLSRDGSLVKAYHIAEILAGMGGRVMDIGGVGGVGGVEGVSN